MSLDGFHPTLASWFAERHGEPTPPQIQGWPPIRAGDNTLIAAPTGAGKTLAAFLTAIDGLIRSDGPLPDETLVLYISPLKALGNDVSKNLQGPLAELRERDPSLPEVRVVVRSGDTTQSERARMRRSPPHVLVTTPESLYILLTSDGGRGILRTVRTVIVDEIHAVAGSKRGSHLALSLERLDALCTTNGGTLQRIGLSATQKPLDEVGRFLVGGGRACTLVDVGHLRDLDLGVAIPPSELSAVCSAEVWEEIYAQMATLIRAHRTTLVFVNTRKMAERVAAKLTDELGSEHVTSHHGSLSKDRRLDAERRLKDGRLRALVATASLELGIDIGDVDLVIQVGTTQSIATFLQRAGRAGHTLAQTPKARLLPLTTDELLTAVALLRSVRAGELDRTPQPGKPVDVLAQQIVAACVPEDWLEADLFERCRRAWPYRDLTRDEFDQVLDLHSGERLSLLHRDVVGGRVRATRRARMIAQTSGGAIPDNTNYRVVMEPEGTVVGSVEEDFAIESSYGDIFQLGNTSWRVLRIEQGTMRVADAQGAPPSLPFWFGEAPARTPELAQAICEVRHAADQPHDDAGVPKGVHEQVANHVDAGQRALGAIPSRDCVILERFFDESGGTQLVLHAPFGGRINRAWGLALRKWFCVSFGFELQAAADEDAILLSLGPQHSFPLEEVFDSLHPNSARDVLTQALLTRPMFQTRWRWVTSCALMLPRMSGGKRVPAPLMRMRADDLLVAAFPRVLACPETRPHGPLEVPQDHPLVRQTLHDCLHEAMDVDGFLDVLRRLRDGSIRRVAVDTPEPSAFARSILSARPYSFLDDAPLDERRTQAVLTRRALSPRDADEIGALDADAVARVREEAWPDPRSADELHEALLWMGHVTPEEAAPWRDWIDELRAAGRVELVSDRWFAVGATRDPLEVLSGRMEALGPVYSDDPLLLQLEQRGDVLRVRVAGREGWCNRRLLARIQRYTVERLRQEIAPVTAGEFLRFLGCWQHLDEQHRLEGPRGVATVLTQLAGFELPAGAWESEVLPARVRGYRPDYLDQITLSGEFAWGRLWSTGAGAIKTTPVGFLPRQELLDWMALAPAGDASELGAAAQAVSDALAQRGALFAQELARMTGLIESHLEMGISDLLGQGLITCDSFGGLRRLLTPPSRRRPHRGRGRNAVTTRPSGRWVSWRPTESSADDAPDGVAELVARQLLDRTGVVFRRTIARERLPVPWRDVLRVLRTLELRGEVRGGRFVAGFDGEQYAWPRAVTMLRKLRREGPRAPLSVGAADPLNFRGILTPDERISPLARRRVVVTGDGAR